MLPTSNFSLNKVAYGTVSMPTSNFSLNKVAYGTVSTLSIYKHVLYGTASYSYLVSISRGLGGCKNFFSSNWARYISFYLC
jgi:hypothetical protein